MSCMDHNGNEFNNLDELADFYGVTARTIRTRLNTGMSLQEAIDKSGFVIDAYEHKFKSVKQFCNFYRITKEEYDNYINNGLTSVKISILLNSIRNKEEYEIQDKKQELDKIRSNKLINVNEDKRHYCKEIYFEDKHFKSTLELCNQYNVRYNTFMKRKRRGWSLYECVYGKPKKEKLNKNQRDYSFDYSGQHFKSYRAFCKHYDINYFTFMRYKNKGHSIEESLKMCESHYFVYGKKFKTITEICEYFHINRSTVNKYYYGNGKNINKAVAKAIKIRENERKNKEKS